MQECKLTEAHFQMCYQQNDCKRLNMMPLMLLLPLSLLLLLVVAQMCFVTTNKKKSFFPIAISNTF